MNHFEQMCKAVNENILFPEVFDKSLSGKEAKNGHRSKLCL